MNKKYHKKNIVITGGMGFIGSNLSIKLVQLGAHVTIIDNMNKLYGGNIYNVKEIVDDINIIYSDINDIDNVHQTLVQADIIYHLAAQVSYTDSINIPFEDLNINALSTLKILDLCKDHNPKVKIVFTSSRMVYGLIKGDLVREDHPTNPLSLYGIHKLTSEKYIKMYFEDYGIPGISLRITNPYGPRQQIKHSKYSIVGWFIRQAMENNTIRIFGDGNQFRDYIYIDDIVEALIDIPNLDKAYGNVLNLGSGTSTRFREMVKIIIDIVGSGKIEHIHWPNHYEKVETGNFSVDLSKIFSIAKWQPKYSLDEGIRKTFEYYTKNYWEYVKKIS